MLESYSVGKAESRWLKMHIVPMTNKYKVIGVGLQLFFSLGKRTETRGT